ncbi:hypothetical protein [Polaromonas sp.]|uniref:hypothetical protein n=1 Tax=Polaromonas sp. TaxID=1869339 RepID=UPI00272F8940|nr:hypothetical protein [Polaromonas sp.]MDP1742877.1 hypothetical protein [Polaromonas sp.]
MFYALCWFVVAALLALWSLAALAFHTVAAWAVLNAGALTGVASGASTINLPDWLAPWMPPEVGQWASQVVAVVAPMVDSMLQAAPALAGGVTVVTWVVWGIGSALLLMVGAGIHLLVALWRRRGTGGSGSNARPLLAAG